MKGRTKRVSDALDAYGIDAPLDEVAADLITDVLLYAEAQGLERSRVIRHVVSNLAVEGSLHDYEPAATDAMVG